MGEWLTLLATMAGAGIALAGQAALHRREQRVHRADLFLEQSATVVALADDFQSRVWEEKTLGVTGRVEAWDLAGCALALARLRILSDDQSLHQAINQLARAGRELGSYWLRNRADSDELDLCWHQYKEACKDFAAASSTVSRAQR